MENWPPPTCPPPVTVPATDVTGGGVGVGTGVGGWEGPFAAGRVGTDVETGVSCRASGGVVAGRTVGAGVRVERSVGSAGEGVGAGVAVACGALTTAVVGRAVGTAVRAGLGDGSRTARGDGPSLRSSEAIAVTPKSMPRVRATASGSSGPPSGAFAGPFGVSHVQSSPAGPRWPMANRARLHRPPQRRSNGGLHFITLPLYGCVPPAGAGGSRSSVTAGNGGVKKLADRFVDNRPRRSISGCRPAGWLAIRRVARHADESTAAEAGPAW